MKLTFKTISGKTFVVEAEESLSIGDLKSKVSEVQADCPRDNMKLVYKGKVLDDGTTVADNQISEQTFIVVFVQPAKKPEAPKPAAAPATAPAAAEASSSAAAAPAAAPAAAVPAPAVAPAEAPAAAAPAAAAPAPAAAAAPGDAYTSAASGLLSGGALESAIANICEMGFPRDEVMRAMRAAFNNPDRAVEYLMTGIPANAGPPPPAARAAHPPAAAGHGAAPPAAAAAAAPGAPAAAAGPLGAGAQGAAGPMAQPFNMFGGGGAAAAGGGAAAAGDNNPLGHLRNNPQFGMLRAAVQTNPQLLVPLLAEMGRSNPELLQQVNEHHQDFLRLLTENPDGEAGMEEAMAMLGGGQPMVVELSEEDDAAINRLVALGFDRDACIEAYLACDKNEEMAANYLAEAMFD